MAATVAAPATAWLTLPATATPAGQVLTHFTVASYNVLSQSLVRRDIFHFASKSALQWSARKGRISAEITALSEKIDVFCLQECEYYEDFFKPLFAKLGFNSVFCGKPTKKDGLAFAWRLSKFKTEPVLQRSVQYDDLATAYPEDSLSRLELMRGNVGHLIALEFNRTPEMTNPYIPGIVLTNTHLFWNPKYLYTKMRQVNCLLQNMKSFAESLPAFLEWPHIMCGDWNTTPDNNLYKILCAPRPWTAEVDVTPQHYLTPPDHFDPTVSHLLRDGTKAVDPSIRTITEEENAQRIEEVLPFLTELQTAPQLVPVYATYQDVLTDGAKHGEPEYTAFSGSLNLALDHIFVPNLPEARRGPMSLAVTELLRIPDAEELGKQTGLPNDFRGSDHVPVGATFALIFRDAQ